MARRKGRKRSTSTTSRSEPRIVKVKTFRGRGKVAGRTCVKAELDHPHRSAVRGVKLEPVEFHGCYISPRKAANKVAALERRIR